jgi:hypothetical protein
MLWLSRVIAQLRTTITGQAPSKTTASQTQTAGLAHQEPTIQRGNKRSAQDTHLLHQPVPQKRKPKRSPVQVDITVASRKRTRKPVQLERGQDGSQAQVPVSQPVSQSRKQDSSPVQSTTQAASQKAVQKPVQTTSGKRGRPTKTPVSQTLLPVKPAVKAKAARVPSIKAVLLSQQEQAHALTRTEAQSGDRGKNKEAVRKIRQPVKQARK